ncbi:cytochrome P450 [Aspergillus novofumigatus IBT 16806]|uniref:Cytochrome P450 n=1 Tax=Aspergillus novofumigatus (strain IBT 16806) TaxID=1392255 RepID=A0A2I1C930_ASPN1|nr:cytochrome P450 [Aspergillus novofumigatus IBT 16806]PKX94106.1 cytochrome P450 [Aspergillus novofumigatus IBT 16806]
MISLSATTVLRSDWESFYPILRYCLAIWIYNLYFHPLAHFPGPLLGRASLLWRFIHTSTGKVHLSIEKLHRQYGPIVRVSPNELSFGSVESWKAIYGHPTGDRPMPVKAGFYDVFSAGFSRKDIGSERDPHKHAAMRRMLSPAFSQRALLEQEKIISEIIDRFVRIVGEKAPPGTKGINMTKWFEMSSFDILGEMAFGESFHSLEAGKPHFWGDLIVEHLYFITLVDNLRRIGAIATLFRYLIPSSVLTQSKNSQYSRNQVEKCLASKASRKEFKKEEMAAHVSTFAIAGGETVSTFLAGTTCFLLQHPDKLDRLVSEIRGAFQSYDEIKAQAAQQLPYLQAVINEGLRLCPPGSQGSPRISPGFELHGRYIPEGAEIYTSPWTTAHDPKYFANPMEFIPERWLDPSSRDIKEASQPLLLGPRSCIGRNFAYMEMNLLMAKLFWTYDLELVNKNINWLAEGQVHVLWWKPKLFIRFHKRAT